MGNFVNLVKERLPTFFNDDAELFSIKTKLNLLNSIHNVADEYRQRYNNSPISLADLNELEHDLHPSFKSGFRDLRTHLMARLASGPISKDLAIEIIKDPSPLRNRASWGGTEFNNSIDWEDPEIKQAIIENLPNVNAIPFADRLMHEKLITPEDAKGMMQNLFKRDLQSQDEENDVPYLSGDLAQYVTNHFPHKEKEVYSNVPITKSFVKYAPAHVEDSVLTQASKEGLDAYTSLFANDPELPQNNTFSLKAVSNPNFSVDHYKTVGGIVNPSRVKREMRHLRGKFSLEDLKEIAEKHGDEGFINKHLGPKFLDFSKVGESIPEGLPNFQSRYDEYFENPSYKIQPSNLAFGIPQWMKERADDANYSQGATLSERSKEYLSKYANLMAEMPEKWHNINADETYYDPTYNQMMNLVDSPKWKEDLKKLNSEYGADFSQFGALGTFREHLQALAHQVVDHDPKAAGNLLNSVPLFHLTGGEDWRKPILGRLNNPEVIKHITDPDMKNFLVIQGLNTDHPSYPSVKDEVNHAYGEILDGDPVNKHYVHFPDDSDSAPEAKKMLWAMEGEHLDRVADKHLASHIMVKRGSATLRYLRDHLEKLKEQGIDAVDPKTLPKDKVWNSILTTSRHTGKDGKVTEHIGIDWNPLRDPKKGGKITVESVQKYIDSMAPQRFNLATTLWQGAQRHTALDENHVVSVNLSDDHVKKLKDVGVWSAYKRTIKGHIPRGHPQNYSTMGWIRYTEPSNKHPIFIDEVQTDLPGVLDKGVEMGHLKDHEAKKIMNVLFEGVHPSEVLHEAFHEYARRQGWQGRKMRMHSSATKKLISLADQDKPVPVHFVRNYEDFPKKRLNAEPATYGAQGHEDSETNARIVNRGLNGDKESTRIWESQFRKMEEGFGPVYSDWDDDC